jgi:hypothetical protein
VFNSANDTKLQSWISHRSHRGQYVGVDYIWHLQARVSYRKGNRDIGEEIERLEIGMGGLIVWIEGERNGRHGGTRTERPLF